MNQQLVEQTFDYNQLDEATRVIILSLKETMQKKTVVSIVAEGRSLAKIKDVIGSDKVFRSWVESEYWFSYQTALKRMHVAEMVDANGSGKQVYPISFEDKSMTELYELASAYRRPQIEAPYKYATTAEEALDNVNSHIHMPDKELAATIDLNFDGYTESVEASPTIEHSTSPPQQPVPVFVPEKVDTREHTHTSPYKHLIPTDKSKSDAEMQVEAQEFVRKRIGYALRHGTETRPLDDRVGVVIGNSTLEKGVAIVPNQNIPTLITWLQVYYDQLQDEK